MQQNVQHLAQLNIARMLASIDSPVMAGFVAQLDEINALAERSPGFVWRLIGASNDATSFRPFDDDFIIVNMSVWQDIESLKAYVYRSDHAVVMRDRRKWFERMGEAFVVLWWIPAGHTPTVEEAKQRLMHLREHGETPHSFTFRAVQTASRVSDLQPVHGILRRVGSDHNASVWVFSSFSWSSVFPLACRCKIARP